MKKIYALAGAALVLGLSASAAPKAEKTNVPQAQKADMTIRHFAKEGTVSNTPVAKEIETVADLLTPYTWSCTGHLGSEGDKKNGPRESVVVILPGDDANHVNISFGSYSIPAAVNISRNTMTIVNQTSVGVLNENDGEAFVYLYKMTEGEDGKYSKSPLGSTAMEIDPELGEIYMDENVWMGISTAAIEPDNRYYYLDGDNVFTPRAWNTPVVEDYELVGDGTFTDGWFNPLVVAIGGTSISNEPVKVYRNKANKNLIAIQNPYGSEKWKEIGWVYEGFGEGWLLFDCTYKNFVCVVPLVNAGVTVDNADPNAGETPGSVLANYYPNNIEGIYQIDGEDIEAIAEEWELNKKAASKYNSATNTLELTNLYFGVDEAPLGAYWWSAENVVKTGAKVVLPEGTLGVQSIASEDNSEARYYNLQGVEVSSPVKGEITIVKKGGKAFKVIVK